MERCLRVAAPFQGFIGFALGRTLWWERLQALHQRQLTAAEAAQRICDNYQRALPLWNEAQFRSDCQRSALFSRRSRPPNTAHVIEEGGTELGQPSSRAQ
ncbi:DUF2090 domain-containing protein [Archangium minus]|uniref:DUF2090 domain-containing protein n=1 Tax=Archangium minus TaxID=83450 RepID=A0ABY9XBB8_9BACT|nr:DUF2090 domain-containing protein [Archangium minus]